MSLWLLWPEDQKCCPDGFECSYTNQYYSQCIEKGSNNTDCAGAYAQCGGSGYDGPTCCKFTPIRNPLKLIHPNSTLASLAHQARPGTSAPTTMSSSRAARRFQCARTRRTDRFVQGAVATTCSSHFVVPQPLIIIEVTWGKKINK